MIILLDTSIYFYSPAYIVVMGVGVIHLAFTASAHGLMMFTSINGLVLASNKLNEPYVDEYT